MALSIAKGQMYDWITHCWDPVNGCPHQCTYCYVRSFKDLPPNSSLNKNINDNLGSNRIIFVGHLTDIFAEKGLPIADILTILQKCMQYPDNEYVFQTKNPGRMLIFTSMLTDINIKAIGTTIETDSNELLSQYSKAPDVKCRSFDLWRTRQFINRPIKTFITIEPIMRFNFEPFIDLLVSGNPDYINIGADSKGHNLPEPDPDEIESLINRLKKEHIEVKLKSNLSRIYKKFCHEEKKEK